jgi:adenylate cyclase
VEIYANAIDTILRQRFLVESSRPVDFLLTLLPAAIAAVLLPRMRLRTGWLVVAGLAAGYLLMVFMAFDRGYILNILYPLIGLPLVSVTVLLSRVLGEQADKRFIRELFGRYVSPQVAGEIINLADAGELKLGGERREVTVLFADMRGFTRLSEQSSPEEIVNLLNQFLSLIIARVLANQGMVNKFAGDNVMGVWNAPQRQPDHALAAVKAAYEAQQAIKNLRETNPNIPQVQFGIGVNTGEAIAGNMGSEGRTEYTVIGDAVNLASRLCSAAPGDEVWIGPGTYELSREYIEVIPLEPQLFKGKKDPIPVYKVVGIEGVFQQGRE